MGKRGSLAGGTVGQCECGSVGVWVCVRVGRVGNVGKLKSWECGEVRKCDIMSIMTIVVSCRHEAYPADHATISSGLLACGS